MNFITENLLEVEKDFLIAVFDWMGDQITELHTFAVEINQTSAVSLMCVFTMLLGAALSGIMVAKQVIGTYGIGTQGDPDQDSMEIIFRLCLALGMMGANSWLFTEIMKFTDAVSKDVTRSFNGALGENLEASLQGMIEGIEAPMSGFVSASFAIGIILFAFSACLRGAEITLSKILLPIFALDLINSNHEKWTMFIFQYGMSFMSYIVQQLCFQMFLFQFFNRDINDLRGFGVTFGWLVLAIRSPKWLEKYIYATGTGQALSRGAGRLGQVIMFAGMRR